MSFCFRRTDGTICHHPTTCKCLAPWTPPLGWMGNSNDGRMWFLVRAQGGGE